MKIEIPISWNRKWNKLFEKTKKLENGKDDQKDNWI